MPPPFFTCRHVVSGVNANIPFTDFHWKVKCEPEILIPSAYPMNIQLFNHQLPTFDTANIENYNWIFCWIDFMYEGITFNLPFAASYMLPQLMATAAGGQLMATGRFAALCSHVTIRSLPLTYRSDSIGYLEYPKVDTFHCCFHLSE